MVTVGMNYQVLPGKEGQFEAVFDKVAEVVGSMAGHVETHLYRSVRDPRSYLIVSRWSDRAAFDAFIASDRFRRVADWGKAEILASRPRHEVYEGPDAPPAGGAARPGGH